MTTMFHEFGHALHGMFADTRVPEPLGHRGAARLRRVPLAVQRALGACYPAVFDHYAQALQDRRAHARGAGGEDQEARKTFNQGYELTEMLAAAELDMQWHTLPAERAARRTPTRSRQQALREDAPRCSRRAAALPLDATSLHIWGGGYSAGYYAYLWTEMLDDDAYQWFEEHGGLTRANGDRFRQMVLSRGNTEDLAKMYANWRGQAPSVEPMLKDRGLKEPAH